MVPPKLPSKGSTPAKPPAGWAPDPNQSSRRPKESQAATAKNRTYFQCSDCSQIITQLGDLGRHWKLDSTNHRGTWFTERAHMFKRKDEEAPHIEYYCVGKSGNTNIWKRCNNQALTDGEDQSDLQSLIDQEGYKYNDHDSHGVTTFVRAPDALRGKRPESGDGDDEEQGEITLATSARSRRGAGQRKSSLHVDIENSPNAEPSSENDGDDSAMNQDAFNDNPESENHKNSCDRDEEDRSNSFVDQISTTGNINSLGSAVPTLVKPTFPTTRDSKITRDLMESKELHYKFDYGKTEPDEDNYEDPDTLADPNSTLAQSQNNARLEARRINNFPNSAESHHVEPPPAQNPYLRPDSSLGFGQPSTFRQSSPYAGAHAKMSQHNNGNTFRSLPSLQPPRPSQNPKQQPPSTASEERSDPAQIPTPSDRFGARPPRSATSQNNPPRRASSTTDRNQLGGPTQPIARAGRDARSMSPREREERGRRRRDNDQFERGFEAGRRQGRNEERNAARALREARAQHGSMGDDEMDEGEG